MISWNGLPDNARVWIYQSDRIFSDSEIERIEALGLSFINSWTAHGSKMKASYKIEHKAFIIIGADEQATKASGCSIDASVHFIQALEKELGINFFDRMNLAILKTEKISFVKSSELARKMEEGKFTEDDLTFNNLVPSKMEFEMNWLIPIKKSWVAQVL